MNTNATESVRDCLPQQTVAYPSFSERMRPRCIDELLLPDPLLRSFAKMKDSKSIKNMIFHGAPGTGKTTCAKLLSDAYDVLSLHVPAQSSISSVRFQIALFSGSVSLFEEPKVVILEEASFLHRDLQAELRGVIESQIRNCRFLMTCNELSKIDPAIQSRCLPIAFDVPFARLPEALAKTKRLIHSRLVEVDAEIDDSRLDEILASSFPDFRRIANVIDIELGL